MVFSRSLLTLASGPVIRDERLVLRLPTLSDWSDWAALRMASRDHLVPWEPSWAPDEFDRWAFRRRLEAYRRDIKAGTGWAFLIERRVDGVLLGGLTLSNVRRGVARTATLGYWIGAPFAGRGHMTAAVRLALGHAFETLNLHRVEAACRPENRASIRVLQKTGFRVEGEARGYLMIDGAWRDHLLFAILADDPRHETNAGEAR
jgi:ribosomal-protein-alanine N-acetyltransferase